MGELPERAAKAASDGLVASSQLGGPQGGRAATAASSRLTIQVYRYDDDECVAVAPGSAGKKFFLILVEAGACETAAFRSGLTIDTTTLADHCPRWRQYAYKPIAADEGLAAVVRHHVAVLAEQEASIDAMASAAMQPMTVALVAALLNSLDNAVELGNLPEFHRRRIRKYVLQHLCNPMLDVEMIAHGVGLSVRYIHHLFQNEPASLMQWAHMKRLERCRELIVDRRLRHRKISQIAYDAGFNDLAHFSRCFRKRFQVSPSQARAAAPA